MAKMTTDEYAALLRTLTPAGERRLRVKHALPASDRDEVLQDAMIEVVRKIESGTAVDNASALLSTILDRRAADKARTNSRRRNKEAPRGDSADLSVLSDGRGLSNESNLFHVDFDASVRELEPHERDAFILHELRGVDQYEAGQILDAPAKTVVSRTERAKEALRKELE